MPDVGAVGTTGSMERFVAEFGRAPEVVASAPGRVNLIGEHTDYNDGFVVPMAIDRRLSVAMARAQGLSCLRSRESGTAELRLSAESEATEGWERYVAGMAWVMRREGIDVPEVDAWIESDVPLGAGLSSSAALLVATGTALWALAAAGSDPRRVADWAHQAESEFVGLRVGVMDSLASALGREWCAMFLDTRSLDIRYVALPAGLAVVVCDTGVPRRLTEAGYNERRAQCEAACRTLGVASLRDATCLSADLEPVLLARARHVLSENQRCLDFVLALEVDDRTTMGRTLRESHESLRDDYDVSCPELDAMAAACWSAPGCVGARMTGAGFGGACVALVERDALDAFRAEVARARPSAPPSFEVRASGGVTLNRV